MHRHSVSRRSHRIGSRPIYYGYSEPICYCDGVPCLCPPEVSGLEETEFLTVYPGWNVWDVWQVKDLPFSLLMMGVSPERQLRIWVEDAVRLGAPGALVADSIDLKGGQVEILNGQPAGLARDQRKEQVPGPSMVVDGPATLRTVRFFNRGDKAKMAWPHDSSYLLDQTYSPSPINPATSGPGPDTIAGTVGKGVVAPLTELLSPTVLISGALVALGYVFRKELFSNVAKRIRVSRASRSR
jgi:hypothetical protein